MTTPDGYTIAPELLKKFQDAAQAIIELQVNTPDTREEIQRGRGLRRLGGRLAGGIKQLMDLADGEPTAFPWLKKKMPGEVKKVLVKAGARILIAGVVAMLPLGWFSFAGWLIRPVLGWFLGGAADLFIEIRLDWLKGDLF